MATEYEEVVEFTIFGVTSGVVHTVRNKAWDTVASNWVVWETASPDITGSSYPGPGTWGVHTSNYRVEMPIFTEVPE